MLSEFKMINKVWNRCNRNKVSCWRRYVCLLLCFAVNYLRKQSTPIFSLSLLQLPNLLAEVKSIGGNQNALLFLKRLWWDQEFLVNLFVVSLSLRPSDWMDPQWTALFRIVDLNIHFDGYAWITKSSFLMVHFRCSFPKHTLSPIPITTFSNVQSMGNLECTSLSIDTFGPPTEHAVGDLPKMCCLRPLQAISIVRVVWIEVKWIRTQCIKIELCVDCFEEIWLFLGLFRRYRLLGGYRTNN